METAKTTAVELRAPRPQYLTRAPPRAVSASLRCQKYVCQHTHTISKQSKECDPHLTSRHPAVTAHLQRKGRSACFKNIYLVNE
jgi:hypothetical protein